MQERDLRDMIGRVKAGVQSVALAGVSTGSGGGRGVSAMALGMSDDEVAELVIEEVIK